MLEPSGELIVLMDSWRAANESLLAESVPGLALEMAGRSKSWRARRRAAEVTGQLCWKSINQS